MATQAPVILKIINYINGLRDFPYKKFISRHNFMYEGFVRYNVLDVCMGGKANGMSINLQRLILLATKLISCIKGGRRNYLFAIVLSLYTKMIKVPTQIMTSYDKIMI